MTLWNSLKDMALLIKKEQERVYGGLSSDTRKRTIKVTKSLCADKRSQFVRYLDLFNISSQIDLKYQLEKADSYDGQTSSKRE
jgi:hypothetical protein